MLKKITVLFFFICCTALHAQNTDLLIGKWVFKKALNKEVDYHGQKTLDSQVINKMTFDLRIDGNFVGFVFGQNMIGKWTLSKNSKNIILSVDKEKFELSILKLTESDLILKIGLGEFLMKRK